MNPNRLRLWLSSAVCLLPLAMAAAQDAETAPPQVKQAVEETKEAIGAAAEAGQEAAQEAAEETKEAAGEAKQAAEQAAEKAKETAKEAAQETKEAAGEAKESVAQAAGVQPKVLVTNLDNPTGLTIHPETGHVFIATHPAVYHYSPQEMDRSKKIHYYIIGYPSDEYGKGPTYKIGPLGLAFHQKHLVVGGGSRPDGEELVHIYEINESADHGELEPIKEESAKFTLGPIKPGDASARGEGNFYSVAVIGDSVFFSSNGDDTKGWILRTQWQDGQFTALEPYIATKEKTAEKLDGAGVDAPVPLTVSPDGKELVVGQMGEVNVPGDSLLTTYNPETGELTGLWKTELNDIAGLAYHPQTGDLYAVDFSWVAPEQGALYRLKVEGENLTSEKITDLDKPTSLIFDKEGNLYVTVFGTAEEGSQKSPGKLLRIKAADLQQQVEPAGGNE